jgi:metal-responsive CopG/Arc/MetJ family transcriptional regulator
VVLEKSGVIMANGTTKERAKKITISLPANLLKRIDALVEENQSNRSAVIADLVRKLDQERFEEEMREGYIANAELSKQIAEEWEPLVNKTWPEW